MAARTERDTLNGLIEICRDGARGFRLSADHVRDAYLKRIFTETAAQRDVFAAELLPHAQRLGGENDAPGSTRAALHRGWMTLKDAVPPHDDRAILEEAIRGEAAAAGVYQDALSSLLPPNARGIIEQQHQAICTMHHKLNALMHAPPPEHPPESRS
jgi:uncharacterized protein (TIGR02284 family)